MMGGEDGGKKRDKVEVLSVGGVAAERGFELSKVPDI